MLQHSHLAPLDEQTIAQAELNAYIEAQAQVAAPEIEIDSDIDSTWGTLYRVWHSYHLLGTFYSSIDGESSAVLGFPQVKQLVKQRCRRVSRRRQLLNPKGAPVGHVDSSIKLHRRKASMQYSLRGTNADCSNERTPSCRHSNRGNSY